MEAAYLELESAVSAALAAFGRETKRAGFTYGEACTEAEKLLTGFYNRYAGRIIAEAASNVKREVIR